MWTTENRARYNRDQLRYPSDVTDAEWAVIAPLIPPARRGGCKRTVNIREVFNGVLDLLSTGCQWRGRPPKLPPPRPGFWDFARRQGEGAPRPRHSERDVEIRGKEGGAPRSTAAVPRLQGG